MKSTLRLLRDNPIICTVYLVFIVIYVLQTVLPAPTKSTITQYQLNAFDAKLISFTIKIPYIIIWVISLIGYLRLKTYAMLIKRDKDGEAFKLIALGLLYLSLWLPVSLILKRFAELIYRNHHAFTANLVRVDTYVDVIILFIGFYYLYNGSNKLLPLISKARYHASLKVTIVSIIFAALYTLLILHDPARSDPTHKVSVASYYESDWLIVTTVIIPMLISWFLGAQAAYNIYMYGMKVKGKLYKYALNRLAIGLSGVIGITILLRIMQSLSTMLDPLRLSLHLLVQYALLILIAISYVYVEKGSRRLYKLEES